MANSTDGNEGLIKKLADLRKTLSPEEQAAFGAMVKLAAGVAEAVVHEDRGQGVVVSAPGVELLKTQSAHAQLNPEEIATLLKTQSSHSVFSLDDLKEMLE
jgi:hypothetical protein